MQMRIRSSRLAHGFAIVSLPILGLIVTSCSKNQVHASSAEPRAGEAVTVGVTTVALKPISRQLTVSSELVPYQETDVFAKESGYVKTLNVDYGDRVKKDQVMAVLEIPELQQLLAQDAAAIQKYADQVTHAQKQVDLYKAQYKVAHLQYTRLRDVAESKKGLVAQQEVDNNEGKDLAAAAQVEVGESALLAAQSQLEQVKAKKQQDQVLFDYSKILAPFDGVVTQRYANLGALMQAGTNSSTQAMPLVRLSEDDTFRLVVPVAESYVKFIRIGDPAQVRVPSLEKAFTGKVVRFSADVAAETRTMHTEVEVHNPNHVLMPGMFAEATLTLEHKADALVVPMQALTQVGNSATVFVVDMNNRLRSRQITLGLQGANEAEVLTGLNEGDRVVVSDRSGLKAGAEVKPQVVDVPQYQSEASQ